MGLEGREKKRLLTDDLVYYSIPTEIENKIRDAYVFPGFGNILLRSVKHTENRGLLLADCFVN